MQTVANIAFPTKKEKQRKNCLAFHISPEKIAEGEKKIASRAHLRLSIDFCRVRVQKQLAR